MSSCIHICLNHRTDIEAHDATKSVRVSWVCCRNCECVFLKHHMYVRACNGFTLFPVCNHGIPLQENSWISIWLKGNQISLWVWLFTTSSKHARKVSETWLLSQPKVLSMTLMWAKGSDWEPDQEPWKRLVIVPLFVKIWGLHRLDVSGGVWPASLTFTLVSFTYSIVQLSN